MTVIAFIMGQLYESRWKWDIDYDEIGSEEDGYSKLTAYLPKAFETNTAFQLGEHWVLSPIELIVWWLLGFWPYTNGTQ